MLYGDLLTLDSSWNFTQKSVQILSLRNYFVIFLVLHLHICAIAH